MGGRSSSQHWQPPAEPMGMTNSDSPVDYHLVGCRVSFDQTSERACCFLKYNVTMDSDSMYAMLGEQYHKGYRMLYFTPVPGDIQMRSFPTVVTVIFHGFFRKNPNLGERSEVPVTWQLHMERSWVQSHIQNSGDWMSPKQIRVVNTAALVDTIKRNTQHGERLISATITGHSETQSYEEFSSGYGPHVAVDMFFEVPCPVPRESYVYNIALVPVHVEYVPTVFILFPGIQCDWMGTLNYHLQQGWRLIDIYVDTIIMEQVRTHPKQRRYLCRPTDTNALWIFEKPASQAQDLTPRFEGTIVEQEVPVKKAKNSYGVQSKPDWLPVIRDMGSRGWELSCVLESHAVDPSDRGIVTLKSLLFFQRPLA